MRERENQISNTIHSAHTGSIGFPIWLSSLSLCFSSYATCTSRLVPATKAKNESVVGAGEKEQKNACVYVMLVKKNGVQSTWLRVFFRLNFRKYVLITSMSIFVVQLVYHIVHRMC